MVLIQKLIYQFDQLTFLAYTMNDSDGKDATLTDTIKRAYMPNNKHEEMTGFENSMNESYQQIFVYLHIISIFFSFSFKQVKIWTF